MMLLLSLMAKELKLGRNVVLFVVAFLGVVAIVTGTSFNSAVAQGNNVTGGGNMTTGGGGGNVTSTSSSGEAKMHLDEGIKALQGGDTNGAMMHLKLADQKLSGGEAKMHLDEGIKALQGGDTNGALMHLKLADQKLT